MNIDLNFRNVSPSKFVREYVLKRITHLQRIAGEIVAARVVVLRDAHKTTGRQYGVRVQLAVAGPDIHASSDDSSLLAAVDRIRDKLAGQLRRRKTRLREHRATLLETENGR